MSRTLPPAAATAGLTTAPAQTSPTGPAEARHQRVDGHARVRFGAGGIADIYQRAPCRLLFPDGEADDFPLAVLVTTSGGLTGGDRIRLDVRVDPDARGTVTSQAAEKLYRVLPGDADIRIDTRLSVGRGGIAEWLAQEAILFDRSRLRRTLEIDLEGNARLLTVEMLMLGRDAMGERFATGRIHDAWRIRRDGRLVWADALHMDGAEDANAAPPGDVAEGACAALAALPFGFGEARAMATLLYAGPDAAAHLDLARSLAPAPLGGATCFEDLLILRLIDRDGLALRTAVTRAIMALRAAALGAPSRLPALWTC